MKVELWVTYRHMPTTEITLEYAFKHRAKKHVFIVETWDEMDFLEGMQLLLGAEITIRHKQDIDLSRRTLLTEYWEVYTTWDPTDRHRI